MTIIAGRARLTASGWGRPVSGATEGAGAVVDEEELDDELVESTVLGDVPAMAAFFLPPPEQAAVSTSRAAVAAISRRWDTSSQLPQRFDALVEWRMGFEQAT
ncbi:MAG TPA: hypothetical protein VLL25_09565 [Acidimicrobiales bacterium]|nr:hypothetical protein [Acidimicrobiales bacterium]